jgi:glycosyltransferase EpsD
MLGNINIEFPNAHLEIIGIGSEKRRFFDLRDSSKLYKIDFRGKVSHEDIAEYYQRSDIFILPSIMEGLSNAIMEAMACGLPIIATDVGGNSELVVDGKGGLLVSPKNVEELYKAIKRLINDPSLRKKMGQFNMNKIKSYDKEIIMAKKEMIIDVLYKKFSSNEI